MGRYSRPQPPLAPHEQDLINDFADDVRTKLEIIIAILESAFDGRHKNEKELISNAQVQIDKLQDNC